MLTRCGLCGKTSVALYEGEWCPRCVKRFARHASRPRPLLDDPAAIFVLVFLAGLGSALFFKFIN